VLSTVGCLISDGESTSFWCDPLSYGGCLLSRFSRLFSLGVNNRVTVA